MAHRAQSSEETITPSESFPSTQSPAPATLKVPTGANWQEYPDHFSSSKPYATNITYKPAASPLDSMGNRHFKPPPRNKHQNPNSPILIFCVTSELNYIDYQSESNGSGSEAIKTITYRSLVSLPSPKTTSLPTILPKPTSSTSSQPNTPSPIPDSPTKAGLCTLVPINKPNSTNKEYTITSPNLT